MFANALSIAFFNYFGMSVTKNSSASYRMVLDSLRTLAVWLVDLASGSGHFHPLQLIGFSLMAAGTAVYNEGIMLPCFSYPSAADRATQVEQRAQAQQRSQALLSGDGMTPSPPLEPHHNQKQRPSPLTVNDYFTPRLTRFCMQQRN